MTDELHDNLFDAEAPPEELPPQPSPPPRWLRGLFVLLGMACAAVIWVAAFFVTFNLIGDLDLSPRELLAAGIAITLVINGVRNTVSSLLPW